VARTEMAFMQQFYTCITVTGKISFAQQTIILPLESVLADSIIIDTRLKSVTPQILAA